MISVVASDSETVHMQCPECHQPRDVPAASARATEQRGRATINWDHAWGVGLCQPCAARRSAIRRHNGEHLTPGAKVTLNCLYCGCAFQVPAHLEATRKYCSRACRQADDGKRLEPQPGNELQALCSQRIKTTGSNMSAFAREAGIQPSTFTRWFREPGARLHVPMLDGIAGVLGLTIGQAVAAAGGTADDLNREQAQRMRASLAERYPTPEARSALASKAAKGNFGRRQSPEHVAKAQASRRASGGAARANEALGAYAESLEGRLVHSLVLRRLKAKILPSKEELALWEMDAAAKMATDVTTVHRIWRRFLIRDGILGKGGRPRMELRHRVVLQTMASINIGPGDQAPYGFWRKAWNALFNAAPRECPPSPRELMRWWYEHFPCGECAGD